MGTDSLNMKPHRSESNGLTTRDEDSTTLTGVHEERNHQLIGSHTRRRSILWRLFDRPTSSTGSPTTTSGTTMTRTRYLQVFHHLRSQWKILVLGQVLSFLLACTGAVQATLHFQCNLSAPTFTVGLFYFALSFLLLVPLCQRYCPCWCLAYQLGCRILGVSKGQDGGRRERLRPDDMLPDEQGSSDGATNERQSAASVREEYPHSLFSVIPLKTHPLYYLPMAFLDVYANYFTVLAFRYTTITSITLLDALAIPTSMILSWIWLKRQYTCVHLLGVLSCSAGIAVNVLQDYHDDVEVKHNTDDDTTEEGHYPHKFRGDVLALLGGVLFGVNNVLGEVAVRKLGGPNEYLGMLGFYATIICIVQSVALERTEIADFFGRGDKSETCHEATAIWLLLAYFASSVLSYIGGARFLQISEATFFNLSLLTGDLWSVAFSVIAERIIPHALFFVALVFILSGVVLYEMAPSPVVEDREVHGDAHQLYMVSSLRQDESADSQEDDGSVYSAHVELPQTPPLSGEEIA